MKKYITVCLCITIMAFYGCATPAKKFTYTSSGKPEVIIKGAGISAVKSKIMSEDIQNGYEFEEESPSMLRMTHPLDSDQNMAVIFSIGNGYSTNDEEITYIFIKMGDGVKIIASADARAKMPNGSVSKASLLDWKNVYNDLQLKLYGLKNSLEK